RLDTPVGAVKGPNVEIVSASADYEARLRKLRRRHVDDLVGPLDRAVDGEVPAASGGVPELVLGDRLVVGIGDAEQRGCAQRLADRGAHVYNRDHRCMIGRRRGGGDVEVIPAADRDTPAGAVKGSDIEI